MYNAQRRKQKISCNLYILGTDDVRKSLTESLLALALETAHVHMGHPSVQPSLNVMKSNYMPAEC
jgi:hypothetical protein